MFAKEECEKENKAAKKFELQISRFYLQNSKIKEAAADGRVSFLFLQKLAYSSNLRPLRCRIVALLGRTLIVKRR